MAHAPDASERGDPPDDPLDRWLHEYIDRLNAGEILDEEEIRREHPDRAAELFARLRLFEELGGAFEAEAPLGTLGDYTLRRRIGRGGMGVVYEAWEGSMDRAVALKVLPAGIAADDRAFHRFLREARTAGKLSHPSVVPVYATGIRDQTPFYAMELIEGETLAEVVARMREAAPDAPTPFGATRDDLEFYLRAARAFADVADGLQHAHSRGVVHRDIKPSNLILDRSGEKGGGSPASPRLRILDFGLARLEGPVLAGLAAYGRDGQDATKPFLALTARFEDVEITGAPPAGPRFIRADSNADGAVDLSDAVFTLGYLFLGGPAPPCLDAADADDTGALEITDAVYSLSFLFLGGPPPPAPWPGCGPDPTGDALGCESFAACR